MAERAAKRRRVQRANADWATRELLRERAADAAQRARVPRPQCDVAASVAGLRAGAGDSADEQHGAAEASTRRQSRLLGDPEQDEGIVGEAAAASPDAVVGDIAPMRASAAASPCAAAAARPR